MIDKPARRQVLTLTVLTLTVSTLAVGMLASTAFLVRAQAQTRDDPTQDDPLQRKLVIAHIALAREPNNDSHYVVNIQLDAADAQSLYALTSAHVGDVAQFIVDGDIIAAPIIRDAIAGGSLTIGMGPEREDAEKFVARINAAGNVVSVRIIPRPPQPPPLTKDNCPPQFPVCDGR